MTEAQASGATAPITQNSGSKSPARPGDGTNQGGGNAPDFKGTKHRVKIDGQEREIPYEELTRGYQTAQAANRRFEAAQKEAAKAQEINKRIEQGDIKWLTAKLGPDKAKSLFEDYLIEQLEYAELPEAEKRARALAAENERLKSDQTKAREEADRERYAGVVDKAHRELDDEIGSALEASGMKPTPRLVIRILDEIEARIVAKEKRIPAAEAQKKAIAGIHQDIAEYLPHLSAAQLREILPKSVIDSLMNERVDKIMGEKQARRVRGDGKAKPADKAPQKPMTQDEWFKRMDDKLKRKRG